MKTKQFVWALSLLTLGGLSIAASAAPSSLSSKQRSLSDMLSQTIELSAETVAKNAQVSVSVELPPEHEFTEKEALAYEVRLTQDGKKSLLKKGKLYQPEKQLPLRFELRNVRAKQLILEIDFHVFFCSIAAPKLCKFKSLYVIQPVVLSDQGKIDLELRAQIESEGTKRMSRALSAGRISKSAQTDTQIS